MPPDDAETRAGIELVMRMLQNRGDADDEPFAAEVVMALRGHGWRPVLAVPASADWRRRGDGGGAPDPSGQGGEAYLAAKAAITARTGMTGPQAALRETGEMELLREGPDP